MCCRRSGATSRCQKRTRWRAHQPLTMLDDVKQFLLTLMSLVHCYCRRSAGRSRCQQRTRWRARRPKSRRRSRLRRRPARAAPLTRRSLRRTWRVLIATSFFPGSDQSFEFRATGRGPPPSQGGFCARHSKSSGLCRCLRVCCNLVLSYSASSPCWLLVEMLCCGLYNHDSTESEHM